MGAQGYFVPAGLISVCVPYWDRAAALARMFATYARHYGSGLEFSVCDDGSPVPAIVPEGVVLTRLPEKQGPLNPCVPINRAVAASHGDIIALTNPEVEHPEPILWEMLLLLDGWRDYVIARCRDVASGVWLAGPEVDYASGGRETVPPGAHFHFLALCGRRLWETAGGFDEDYRHGQACEDNDWLWRLQEAGARFKTTRGVVEHGRVGVGRWGIPHNAPLFRAKWPEERRRAALV